MQVFVPGPLLVQVAWVSHPPLAVAHESTAAQTVPLPVYPVLHVHVGPVAVDVHFAVAAQPPFFVAQDPTPVHVVPLPV